MAFIYSICPKCHLFVCVSVCACEKGRERGIRYDAGIKVVVCSNLNVTSIQKMFNVKVVWDGQASQNAKSGLM